jgi:glucose-6-phosphate isomerase
MQLPDENIEYQFQRLLVPHPETWSPVAELQAQHLLPPDELERIKDKSLLVRGIVVAERERVNPPPHMRPLHAGFIDLPQKLLDGYKRKQDASDLGKTLRLSQRLRDTVDRVVVLATGAAHVTARALFEALCHAHHNELPPKLRMGKPRIHFEGHALDSDGLQELFELLENTCVDPDIIEERWGVVAINRTGDALETASVYRALRAEAAKFYGPKSPLLKQAIVPVAGAKGKFRDLLRADGFADDDVLTMPDDVGDRFGAFTPAGLLPAAVMGLDVRAMLLGAATVTRRFVEEPFERNPVLQFAGTNCCSRNRSASPGAGRRRSPRSGRATCTAAGSNCKRAGATNSSTTSW